ncbi:hypothetical protein N7510_008360 [Penicillium lagena]|uniref:uncharacterized protein n=1 Tax=Penicillium lagena TaxID=94218 RepID=UPI0025402C64|nr:uncharacterized protein N7510_008360 [Penicillium lagena]KAJ5605579.1 hypothetical protein N7510_008360 [Penicillium lagena]
MIQHATRVRKIGCGRELPSCSNCVKAKIKCERSNKGKKPNQTNKLVNDLEQVGNRLGDLEKNVSLIHHRLDEFFRGLPPQQHNNPTNSGEKHRYLDTPIPLSSVVIPSSPSGSQDVAVLDQIAHHGKGTNRLMGTSALISLFEDADDKIDLHLDAMRPKASLRDILGRKRPQEQSSPQPPLDAFLAFKSNIYHGLSLSTFTSQVDLSSDGNPLLLPPKRLLDPIFEPYFRHISSVVPIMGRQPCLNAIKEQYSPEVTAEKVEPAWVILFNYMILFCFVGRYMPLDRPSSDVDVVSITHFEKPFIINIRRSFSVIHQLLTPKLVNVQALLALTLISQKYFSEHVTQYLLNQTCFVAKAMGLHEERYGIADLTTEDIDDRRRVFSCLFIVDKDVSMLLGTPPNLHNHDCDVAYPLYATYDYRLRLDYSLIVGKVYGKLYSPAATRGSLESLEYNVDELLGDLDIFQRAIDNVSQNETDSMHHRAWQFLRLEQKHFVHHARLMVLRRSSQPSKYARRLLEARQCIRTISKIRAARTTVGGFMVLRRPFQWRPFVAFFEILPTIFTYPLAGQNLDDLERLKELVSMLRFVTSADDPSSYCGKLLRIAGGCIEITEEFVQQCLQHQNSTSPARPLEAHSNLQKKRKASPTAWFGDVRARQVPSPSAPSYRPGELGLSNSVDTTEFTSMSYNSFGGNGLQDMFPGWPQAGSLPFLDEELFWGDGEDVFGSQHGISPIFEDSNQFIGEQ